MRRWLVALAAAGLTMLSWPPAAANPPTCKVGPFSDQAVCGGRDSSPGGGRDRATTGTTVPLIRRTLLRQLPDGSYCGYEAWVPPSDEPVSLVDHPELLSVVFAPPCPVADPVEASAREFWQTVVLPRPEPGIRPGRAITGKTASLEIGGTRTRTFTVANPLGGPPIEIQATGRYTVDWGDGTSTTTTSQGGPWPDGDVTHVWTTAGAYDVVVTQQWTATWRAGPAEGVLDGLQTVGRLDDFPVQEVQAVRNR